MGLFGQTLQHHIIRTTASSNSQLVPKAKEHSLVGTIMTVNSVFTSHIIT